MITEKFSTYFSTALQTFCLLQSKQSKGKVPCTWFFVLCYVEACDGEWGGSGTEQCAAYVEPEQGHIWIQFKARGLISACLQRVLNFSLPHHFYHGVRDIQSRIISTDENGIPCSVLVVSLWPLRAQSVFVCCCLFICFKLKVCNWFIKWLTAILPGSQEKHIKNKSKQTNKALQINNKTKQWYMHLKNTDNLLQTLRDQRSIGTKRQGITRKGIFLSGCQAKICYCAPQRQN